MPSKRQQVRRFVALLLGVYVVWLVFGYQYHFLDGVNLLIHEAGHFLFGAAPEAMAVAGGTILQLAFPVLFAWYFWRRSSIFEGAVVGVWVAESLMYTARYLGDAQAQELPLIGDTCTIGTTCLAGPAYWSMPRDSGRGCISSRAWSRWAACG